MQEKRTDRWDFLPGDQQTLRSEGDESFGASQEGNKGLNRRNNGNFKKEIIERDG